MAVTLEELQIRFTAQMGNLNTQLNGVKNQLGMVSTSAGKAQGAMSGLAKTAKLFIGAYLVRGIYKIGKASLEMANEVVESESLFAVSMKGMADDARAWSDDLSSSLGINAYEARKNAGVLNTMFMSMGLGTDKAYEMSTGLAKLAYDMASFYNVDNEEMFTKIRSGIAGETEPLRRLGVMVDENTVKQYALAAGFKKSWSQMTSGEKALVRYTAIMAQTADAQGDLARTINSPVNQIRLLNNTLDMAKIALGQAFQPIQAMILPVLHSLAQAALTAANALKSLIWALTGFKGIGTASTLIAGAGADANSELANSLEDSADAYKKAGGAAKKASKDAKIGLKAFDEINKLTEESAEKGGGGAGLAETPEIIKPEQATALDTVSAAVSKAADWLKRIWEIAEPTRAAMGRLWDQLKKFGSLTWDAISWFYEKILKPIGEWTLTTALPKFLDMVSAGVGFVNKAMERAKGPITEFYNRVLVPLGEWAGQQILNALDWLKEKFNALSDWIDNNQAAFNDIVDVFFSFGVAIISVWAASKLIASIQAAFALLGGVLSFFTSPTGWITLIIGGLLMLIYHWDDVRRTAERVAEAIKKAWFSVRQWWEDKVIGPIKALWNDFLVALGLRKEVNIDVNINQRVNTTYTKIGVPPQITETPIPEQQGEFTNWGDVEAPQTPEKKGLRGILSLQKVIDDTAVVHKIGRAKGGVFKANEPILSILGDQKSGRNIEAPEGVLREIFRDEIYRNALSGVNTSTSYSSLDSASGSNIVQQAVEAVLDKLQITLNVDGQTFGKASIRAINTVQRNAGTVLFEM